MCLSKLHRIRASVGQPLTNGLSDEVISQHIIASKDLRDAIELATLNFESLSPELSQLLRQPESEAVVNLRKGVINFYSEDCSTPFVPLAAKGAWIVTAYGRVVFETGGYGMIGYGHSPEFLKPILSNDYMMANVMTASFSQKAMVDALKSKLGVTRKEGCPYKEFIFMNSGSESMTVATRISDSVAGNLTAPSARYDGWKVKFLGLQGGFHGRTERPAQASHSCQKKYQNLATFRNAEYLWVVPPNDLEALKAVFAKAKQEKVYFESMMLEPVMGEGDPGLAITPEFYALARALTKEMGTLLIVDSIQAGIRAAGVLSIVDYPGFSELDPPDIESFSKAINAGQYPLSVLALTSESAKLYAPNTYGNTMTSNPRALEVGRAVLERLDDKLTNHIRQAGLYFLEQLRKLESRYPTIITKVQGTGLLISLEFIDSIKVYGSRSLEEMLRLDGLNVIHGGVNSLRFTPPFNITNAEIDLIISLIDKNLQHLV